MKRNILLAFTGLLLAVGFFTPAKEYLYNQKNVASSALDYPAFNKSFPEKIALPESLSPYPKLPFKELIFPTRQFLALDEPSIIELSNGELFAVWSRSMFWGYNSCIWGARRPVGSNKWAAPSVIHDTKTFTDINPVLYINKNQKLCLLWTLQKSPSKWNHKSIINVKVSDDLGNTWGRPHDVGTPMRYFSRSRPAILHNGWFVLPIYLDWSASSAIIISKDGGLTWGKPKWILPFFGIEPTIIQRSDLSLFALMRSGCWPHRSWQVASKDLDHSWKEQKISSIKNPGSALEMIKLRNGHVALVFNDSEKDRSNLSIALSYDDGETWPHIKAVENQPGHIYDYPSVIQDRYGLIHVVYSYDDQSIAHFVTNEQWIES